MSGRRTTHKEPVHNKLGELQPPHWPPYKTGGSFISTFVAVQNRGICSPTLAAVHKLGSYGPYMTGGIAAPTLATIHAPNSSHSPRVQFSAAGEFPLSSVVGFHRKTERGGFSSSAAGPLLREGQRPHHIRRRRRGQPRPGYRHTVSKRVPFRSRLRFSPIRVVVVALLTATPAGNVTITTWNSTNACA